MKILCEFQIHPKIMKNWLTKIFLLIFLNYNVNGSNLNGSRDYQAYRELSYSVHNSSFKYKISSIQAQSVLDCFSICSSNLNCTLILIINVTFCSFYSNVTYLIPSNADSTSVIWQKYVNGYPGGRTFRHRSKNRHTTKIVTGTFRHRDI
jgi:hypothetical protein